MTGPARPIGINELIGLTILSHVSFAGARVGLTLTALHLQASTFTVGMILSLLAMLPMLLAIPGGRWVDRIGVRWPMIGGVALVMTGVLLPLAWPSIGVLYVTAMLVGLGYLPFHLGAQKLVADIGSVEDRRHHYSLYAIGFSVSGFIGPTLVGFLIDAIGHRLAFGVLGMLSVVTLTWLNLRRAALPDHGGGQVDTTASLRIWDLLRTPDLRRLYVVVALISSAWDVHQFLVPIYGARIGLSASGIGLILGAFSVATLVVRLVVPLFLMNVSEWRVIMIAQSIAAGVYAFYPLFSTLESMLAMSFLLGLGLGASQPMTLSILARSAPASRLGEATGLRMTLVNGTQTVLPGTFGALGGLLGVAPLFWAMAALLAGGAGSLGRFLHRRG